MQRVQCISPAKTLLLDGAGGHYPAFSVARAFPVSVRVAERCQCHRHAGMDCCVQTRLFVVSLLLYFFLQEVIRMAATTRIKACARCTIPNSKPEY